MPVHLISPDEPKQTPPAPVRTPEPSPDGPEAPPKQPPPKQPPREVPERKPPPEREPTRRDPPVHPPDPRDPTPRKIEDPPVPGAPPEIEASESRDDDRARTAEAMAASRFQAS